MPLRSPAGFISAFFDPLKNPDAPTSPAATAGDTLATVSFTAPANVGGSAITAYYAVSNPGQITTSGASSPITATGLTNGTAYTFNVWALNSYGPGVWSAATGSVTPVAFIPTALFGGGSTTDVFYSNISTLGNATTFGTLSGVLGAAGVASSSTRGVFFVNTSSLSYTTFATTGSFASFGNSVANHGSYSCGMSSSTRGVFGGGQPGNLVNFLDYITIATTGNATYFGDNATTFGYAGGCASPTRGVFAGGLTGAGYAYTSAIKYITIATTGDTSSFGSLTFSASWPTSSCSNATRGLFAGGNGTSALISNIDYITIASAGNGTNFGNLSVANAAFAMAASPTRALFAGGEISSGAVNTINYVTIASTGNTTSFGSLPSAVSYQAGCSNSHGGL
jgi:hypothetical protein